MDSGQNRVSVDILGERFVIRGDARPDHIAEVANLVDAKMRELARSVTNVGRARLAILAAINIADELLVERENAKSQPPIDEEFTRRTHQLITLLDEGLVGDQLDDE